MRFLVLILFILAPNLKAASIDAKQYIKIYGLKKAIGQMFVVSIPEDYKNFYDSEAYKIIIDELNVGGVMINQYNLPSSDLAENSRGSAFKQASTFIKALKGENKTGVATPLLVFSDFENYKFTSIQFPLTPPPSPLVLSTTGDLKYAYYSGKISGNQLRQLGIDVILGPVLDLDKSRQGHQNFTVSLRSFSDNYSNLIPYSRAFLEGLNETGMISFSKHFPSYGSSLKNSHKESTVYNGSVIRLDKELDVFDKLKDEYQGVMTSHLIVNKINKTKPATYSKKIVTGYLKEKLNNKVIITDDLSNMKSSKIYIENIYNEFSYKKSSLDAFKSGHDLLLYSHIKRIAKFNKEKKRSDFSIEHLRESIDEIENVIESDPEYLKQFEKTLNKLIFLKSKSVDNGSNVFDYASKSIFINETEYHDVDSFYRKAFDNGVVKVSNGEGSLLVDYRKGMKVLFSGPEKYLKKYKIELNGRYNGFEEYYLDNTVDNFEEKKRKFVKLAKRNDRVIYVIEEKENFDILDNVRIYHPELLNKIIVFLHASPLLLNTHIIGNVLIYGNFSENPYSYKSDVKVLSGDLTPKVVKYLPVSLSDGNEYDSANKIPPINTEFLKGDYTYFNTKKEQEFYNKLNDEKDKTKKLESDLVKLNDKVSKIEKDIGLNYTLYKLPMYYYFISLLVSTMFIILIVKRIGNFTTLKISAISIYKESHKGLFWFTVVKKIFFALMIIALLFPELYFLNKVIEAFVNQFPFLGLAVPA